MRTVLLALVVGALVATLVVLVRDRDPAPPPAPAAVPTQIGCGQRATERGAFDPTCPEYQGDVDPGRAAGRRPTSGELQTEYGCRRGYIPADQC